MARQNPVQPESAGPTFPRPDRPRSLPSQPCLDEPWASGQRKRYLASLAEGSGPA